MLVGMPLNESREALLHKSFSRIFTESKERISSYQKIFSPLFVKPRFSISPLLRLFNRLNLREKNQKLFVNVE